MPDDLSLRRTVIGGEAAPDDYAVIWDGLTIWMSMQAAHDLWVERQKIKGELANIKAVWNPPAEIPVEDD
jgi:hypothetical protein